MLPFLIIFLISVESSLSNPFSLSNPPIEISNKQSNRVIKCGMEGIIGLKEIQELIESLAVRKGTTSFSITKMLLQRMKNEDNMLNPIGKVAGPPMREAIYSIPSQKTETDVVIIPVAPSSSNRPLLNANYRIIPGMFPPLKNNQFAATVRVNSNSPLMRDIIITVSPLMTLIEALRQAEIKYQNILGLTHETRFFTFSHSPIMNCYMINQVNGLLNTEEHAWQVTISDRDSQVMYSDFCLPSGRDAFVKPGTLISLSYVPL